MTGKVIRMPLGSTVMLESKISGVQSLSFGYMRGDGSSWDIQIDYSTDDGQSWNVYEIVSPVPFGTRIHIEKTIFENCKFRFKNVSSSTAFFYIDDIEFCTPSDYMSSSSSSSSQSSSSSRW